MPVYDFRCKACGHTDEYVKSFNDDEVPDCDICDTSMTQLVSLWAKTPGRWGDTNGYFDRGLGCYVKNFSHRDKLMKERDCALFQIRNWTKVNMQCTVNTSNTLKMSPNLKTI